MQSRKLGFCIFIIVLINILLIFIGHTNNSEFWSLTLSGILSLDMTAIVSVLVVQTITSKRRQYDFLVKKLDEILANISKDYLFERTKEATLLQKSISNQLEYISKACPSNVNDDVKYIKEKFDELLDYYGDHGTVSASDVYFEKGKTNIKDRILKLQLGLYGFDMKEDKKHSH